MKTGLLFLAWAVGLVTATMLFALMFYCFVQMEIPTLDWDKVWTAWRFGVALFGTVAFIVGCLNDGDADDHGW